MSALKDEDKVAEVTDLLQGADAPPPDPDVYNSTVEGEEHHDVMKKLLGYLGNFGRYQAFLYLLLVLPGALGGVVMLSFSWTGYSPDARCRLPTEPGNSTWDYAMPAYNKYYPYRGKKDWCSTCVQFNETDDEQCVESSAACSNGLVFNLNAAAVPRTVVTDHRLACGRMWLKQLVWSSNTLGVMFGAIIFSIASDKYGRRRVFLLAAALTGVVSFAACLATNYVAFVLFQIALGCISYGTYLTVFIAFMELVDGLPRTICGIWYQAFFTFGALWLALSAYVTPDWQLIQLLAAAPTLLYVAYYWLFPESIRWLIVNNRQEEARKALITVAKVNRVTIPDSVLKHELHPPPHMQAATVLDLFSHWRLAKNTLIVFYAWFAASMGYYGISQNTADLPGDPFQSFILAALCEWPAYLVCVPLMEYAGRRVSLCASFILGGAACILAGLIASPGLVLATALLGKMCVSAAFAIAYNYSAEIFPTVVRQSGTGLSSVGARVGALLAPQIRLLGTYVSPTLPIIIYGSVAVLAGVLAMFLPETLHKDLPETIEDGINFGTEKQKAITSADI